MKIHNIILGVIVCILLYVIYYFVFASKGTMLNKFNNAQQPMTVSQGGLPKGGNSEYSWSVWFYVNQWNYRYGEDKVIFRRGTVGNPGPSVYFDPYDNTVHISVNTYPSTQSETQSNIFDCAVPNIPIQSWTNLIISLNTRSLDVYLQGKLVKTCLLPGVAKVDSASSVTLTPGGGFSGYTSDLKYFDYSLNPQQAYNIYKQGYSGSSLLGDLFNRFRLRLSFIKDNTTVNSLDI
jgi:hypothetical protein